jgi:zinc transport system permease protein
MTGAMLSYGFVQRALVSGLLIAVACALLGVFLVLRKEAMVGHGFSHIAFFGVAAGLFLRVMPLAAALVLSVLAALAMRGLKEKAGIHGDTAIGILSSLGMALGIVLAGLSRGFGVELMGYLFGDILAISPAEVWLAAALSGAVILAVILNYPKLLLMTFDLQSARVAGINVKRLDALLVSLTATTVVLGMKITGLLLVAALLVIPAAAGLQVASSFRSAMASAAVAAVLSVLAGIFAAMELDIPASASVVLAGMAVFGLFYLWKRVRRARRSY